MKLIWNVREDAWTCEKTLSLLNDNGLAIWSSKIHEHCVDKEVFDKDIKHLIEKYKLDQSITNNIEEIVKSGRVT